MHSGGTDDASVSECDLCGYVCDKSSALETHFSRHRIVYACTICCSDRCRQRLFPSALLLTQHLHDAHGDQKAFANNGETAMFERCIDASMFLPEPDGSMDDWMTSPVSWKEKGNAVMQCCDEAGDVNGSKLPICTSAKLSTDVDCSVENCSTSNSCQLKQTEESGVILSSSNNSSVLAREKEATIGLNCDLDRIPALEGFDDTGRKTVDHDISVVKESDAVDPSPVAAEDNIFAKLGYHWMNPSIFRKLRETFGNEECVFCGKLFTSKLDCETHMRSHTGEYGVDTPLQSYR